MVSVAFRSESAVPSSFEDHVMVQGPLVFQHLVDELGGRAAAIEASGLASSTWARWLQRGPGTPFGPGVKGSMRRSLWFGYPAPFPGLDRVAEELLNPDASYMQVLVEKWGWVGAYAKLESTEGFGLMDVGIGKSEVEGLDFIPHTTRRRMISGLTVPKPLICLDRLARSCHRLGWFEAVSSFNGVSDRPRVVPLVAIRALIDGSNLAL